MNYLDLDAVSPDNTFFVRLNGKEHQLHIATVDTFVANLKDLETLSMNASAVEELNVAIRIIGRAFPTIPEKEVRKLTVMQVKQIADYAMQANGEKVQKADDTAGSEGGAEGNDNGQT